MLVAALSSALLYRKYLQHKVAEERAITSPNGINNLEPVRIGGIDQWVEVRGQNVNNPILLFIHGGPGIPFMPLAGGWKYLRSRFKREKIFVPGHSWGSVPGLWLAHEHPELVYAYVGVGQVINTAQNEVVGYQDAWKRAQTPQ